MKSRRRSGVFGRAGPIQQSRASYPLDLRRGPHPWDDSTASRSSASGGAISAASDVPSQSIRHSRRVSHKRPCLARSSHNRINRGRSNGPIQRGRVDGACSAFRRPTAGPVKARRSIARLQPNRRSIRRNNFGRPEAAQPAPLRLTTRNATKPVSTGNYANTKRDLPQTTGIRAFAWPLRADLP